MAGVARQSPELLSGCIVAALEDEATTGPVEAEAVEKVLAESQTATWTEAPTVGEGKKYRAEFNGTVASALMLNEATVHLNVVMKPEEVTS